MIMIMAGEKKNHKNAGLKADKGLTLLFMHLIIYKNYLHLLSPLDSRNSPKAAKGK